MKEWNCIHCNKTFEFDKSHQRANHSRWCEDNPKSKKYRDNLVHSRNKISRESRIKANEKIKQNWKNGKYDNADHGKSFRGKTHSEESKQKIREKALASDHRRLVRNPIKYKGVLLDSTWELELAKRLDSLSIEWIRPKPLKWVDTDGIEHNYFPDFYLPVFNLYLDPKNPQAFKVQRNKIEILDKTYDNIIWLTSLDECQNFGPIVKGI